ncbi:MAG TPA: type II toxin-antitoxin system RelE/ParE family toxin, partial [Actinophytocola sp.]|uniref:type II toxin-antitoxin system RelE/ParE family toxin n=1 Tax=Actinophytocola sp. TaxID=1872138 RepID=UPI002E082758|nr:type II toxin-antitoxin system RelE/ParE family toxin [Actinophytocola sp.]
MDVIPWGEVELEPEVKSWIGSLNQHDREIAEFYINLLAEQGVLLGEPYTRQLDGKLRELRFNLNREAMRISYWTASGRRIILLTVFRKQRMRERAEMARARRAMQLCIRDGHTPQGRFKIVLSSGSSGGTRADGVPVVLEPPQQPSVHCGVSATKASFLTL